MESTVGEPQIDALNLEALIIVGDEVSSDLVEEWLKRERKAFCNGFSPATRPH